MKNRCDDKSVKKLFFAYRLTTDSDAYIQRVVADVKVTLEKVRSVHVVLAFVKGVGRTAADEILRSVTEGLGEIDASFCEKGENCFIRVSPFLGVSLQAIRRVEGKSNKF